MDFIESQLENLFKKHYSSKESFLKKYNALKESVDNDKDNVANDICGIHRRLIELQNDINDINNKPSLLVYRNYINKCYDECNKTKKDISYNDKIYLGHIYVLYILVCLLIGVQVKVYYGTI
uniref:Uncharacterized protein n=1 Tax=viral metagenome TaxID=1070528 RepID=A0A6C0EV64_9ZZZZ